VTYRYGRRRIAQLATGAVAAATVVLSVTAFGSPAYAGVASANATDIAAAIAAPGTDVTGASFVAIPGGTPDGVGNSTLGGFPTQGSSFGILTTGDVNSATDAPPSTDTGTTTDDGGDNVRGDTDFDVSILKINFTVGEGMNCLSFDFRFFSEEYPEFVGGIYDDAFIAELDNSTWTTNGPAISAPNNFAFDPAHNPISINAAGATSMVAGPLDTTYDGATPTLTASTAVTPGDHSLYLSIFDQGDNRFDSAVFLDNLIVGHSAQGGCVTGAEPKSFALSLTPPTATKTVGTSHTVTAKVNVVGGINVDNGKVLYSVTGANSGNGTGTTNSSGISTYSYTGSHAGSDSIKACYDENNNGTCDTGEVTATVAATWVVGATTVQSSSSSSSSYTAPASTSQLPSTGQSTGIIAGLGLLCVAIGATILFLYRRRRLAEAANLATIEVTPTDPPSTIE
jgi:LPXTG-motif cell wall-anchored protein